MEKGITAGKTDTTFAPNEQCTKAQIITFLWRAFGSPEPALEKVNDIIDYPNNSPFTDLNGSEYYFKAAQWAYTQEMIRSAAFNGDEPCTRQYAMFYMYVTAGRPEQTNYAQFSVLPNQPQLRQAVYWGINEGVTNGTTDTTFSPEAICTRAQIMTFLYRYLENKPAASSTSSTSQQQTETAPMSESDRWNQLWEQLTEEERGRAWITASGKIVRGERALQWDNGQPYYTVQIEDILEVIAERELPEETRNAFADVINQVALPIIDQNAEVTIDEDGTIHYTDIDGNQVSAAAFDEEVSNRTDEEANAHYEAIMAELERVKQAGGLG